MNADKIQVQDTVPRVFQPKKDGVVSRMEDNRTETAIQARLVETLQRAPEDEDELLQGKFVAQRDIDEEDELLQGRFVTQKQEENHTGIPDEVKQRMESSFGADFSSVRVHSDSSKAPEVGALAFTQGTDIHFAPGQFKPETSSGQQLLGHELAHVVQQSEGRVQPTTEIAGMSVNDDVSLEHEADVLGAKAAL